MKLKISIIIVIVVFITGLKAQDIRYHDPVKVDKNELKFQEKKEGKNSLELIDSDSVKLKKLDPDVEYKESVDYGDDGSLHIKKEVIQDTKIGKADIKGEETEKKKVVFKKNPNPKADYSIKIKKD